MKVHPLWKRTLAVIILQIGMLGCNPIDWISDKLQGPYHHLSFGRGDYLRIHRRASNRMIEGYDLCKAALKKSDAECGKIVLQKTRGGIRDSLGAVPRAAWDSVYHHAWNDGEGGDFAQAIKDLRSRKHECLTAHFGLNWVWSSPNWTTADISLAECSEGRDPCPQGIVHCDYR